MGERSILETSLAGWIVALGIAVVVFVVLLLIRRLASRRLARVAALTTTPVDDLVVEVLKRTGWWSLAAVAAWFGSRALTLEEAHGRAIDRAVVVILIIQGASWLNRAVALWIRRQRDLRTADDPGAVTTLQGLSYVVRLAVWSAALLLMLDNLGVDVTALVAGLGVGGIAVALAVQNILGDLFASLSIALDKPFVIGDFVIVGDFMGTIERVGLKTTRIRSLSGEQLVFSNSDLLASRIRNYKRMQERRVAFSVGVTYQTSPDTLEAIPGMIRELIENQPTTRFDRAHFKAFGDSAYLFEIVYYVLDPDYNRFMDTQQAINLGICRRFAEHGIEFAYPTRTVHLAGGPRPAGLENTEA
jgi:small-conductance mechanosensitive channel